MIFWLRQICVTLFFSVFLWGGTLSAQYCQSSGNCQDHLVTFSFSNFRLINNDSMHCALGNGYQYHTADTVYLVPGATYYSLATISLWFDTHVAAWIDNDFDEIFDTIEQVEYATGLLASNRAGAHTVSPSQPLGNSRMRIVLYSLQEIRPDPCGTFNVQVIDVPVRFVNEIPVGNKPDYCMAKGVDTCLSSIINVSFQEISRSSTDADCKSNSYTFFSSDTAKLIAGMEPFPIQVILSDNPAAKVTAWIDWNHDNDFSQDNDEEVHLVWTQDGLPNGYKFTGIVNVPATAVIGTTRLRIRAGESLLTLKPCDSIGYEVEDYHILYIDSTALPGCVRPFGMSPAHGAANLCQRTMLKWRSVDGSTGYKVTLIENGSVLLDNVTCYDTVFDPGVLAADGYYRWVVTPYNSNGSAQWCDTADFYTAPAGDPTVNIIGMGSTDAYCSENNIQLGNITDLGTPPFDYTWTTISGGPVNFSSAADQATVEFAAAAGVHFISIMVSDANGCRDRDTLELKVGQSPILIDFFAADSSACEGDSLLLFLKTQDAGKINWEESFNLSSWWPVSNIFPVSDSEHVLLTMTGPRYYRSRLISQDNNCETVSQSVFINTASAPLKPYILVFGDSANCAGDTVELITNTTDNHIWNNGDTSRYTWVFKTGYYYVTHTGANGCSANSEPVFIDFETPPSKPYIIEQGDSLICSEIAATYQWYWQYSILQGAVSRGIAPVSAGPYAVIAFSENGCASQLSDNYYHMPSGVDSQDRSGIAVIGPNPASTFLNIFVPGKITIGVYDPLGGEVLQQQSEGPVHKVDLKEIAPGTYFITVSGAGDQLYLSPFIIAK